MADFQYPDLLGSYIRGNMAPGQQVLQNQAIQGGQQDLAAGGLKLDQLRMAVGNQQMYQDVAKQQLQGQGYLGGSQAAGAQNVGAPAAHPVSNPAGGMTMGGDSVLGFSPQTLGALAILRGDDPLKTAEGLQSYQLTQHKLQLSGPMDLAKSVANDPQADVIVKNNPSLQQAWIQNAPKLGLDPFKDLNPINARRVAALAYNGLAGQVGEPGMDLPVMEQDVKGPLNSLYQRNPRDNSLKTVRGEEDLKQVIGPDGMPTLAPASAAAGKQPFNASMFGAANMSDQALQFAADTYRTTGKFPGSFGRNPAMQAKVLEKVAADATASGDTAGAIAARQGALRANGMALDTNTKLLTATRGYAETLDKNLDNLLQSYSKVDSSGSPLINRGFRAWQQNVTGDPKTADMVTWLNAVQGEYAKLRSGSLGNQAASDAAMKDAKEVINKNFSQGGIQAVAAAIRQEKDNRLSSIQAENASLTQAMGAAAPGTRPATSGGMGVNETKTVGEFKVTRVN